MTLILELPAFASASMVVAITIFAAFVPYLIGRKLFLPKTDEQTRDLAYSVVFRVSALHSLILALVFAQELLQHEKVRSAMTTEAILVGNVFWDLDRYGGDSARAARFHMTDYAEAVLTEEWDSLAREGLLSESAWAAWEQAYNNILDLESANSRQESLRNLMVNELRQIAALRQKRQAAATFDISKLFMFAAFAGIILVSIGYYPFPPSAVNLTLLGVFATYTGLVIYMILSFSSSYGGAGHVEPTSFQILYLQDMVEFHR